MKNRRNVVLVLVAVAVILTATIGGTIAWLQVQTPALTNTFTPSKVACLVQEDFADTSVKKDVNVKNTGNINAYIRAEIVGNWCNADGEIVQPWTCTVTTAPEGWKLEDGYFYCTSEIAPNGVTPTLASRIEQGTVPDGCDHLEVTILAQAIQAEPFANYQAAWNATKTPANAD